MHRFANKITIGCMSLLLIMTILLTGCGKRTVSLAEGTRKYAWPIGTSSPEDTVTQLYAEKFAEEVKRLSNGSMEITVYPNSVIGGDRELLESCSAGDVPFVIQNTAPQVSFLPRLAVFDIPCAFTSIDELRQTIDQPEFLEQIEPIYEEGGYHLLGFADQGFRVMSTNHKVESLKDFKGQKIRTMENPYHLDFWKALGSNPTPMTFSEIYIGLQQKTIDAQENPYEVIVSGRLYEQQDYMIETNHLPHLISLIVNQEFYQKLPKQDQQIIEEAAAIAKEYARNQSDARIAARIQTIKDSGTEIITLSPELQNQLKEIALPIRDEIQEMVGEQLVGAYLQK